MATNEILPFAGTDNGTNLLTQAEYDADSQRPIGNQPGVARSKLVNKVLRQTSLIAAAVAQFLANRQANDITDSLTPATLAGYFLNVIGGDIQKSSFNASAAGGTVNAITGTFTPAITALSNGLSVFIRASGANTATVPTFTPNNGVVVAKAVVKGANRALVAGDIAGAGHWIELQYDATLDKWVLQNPATGVLESATQAGVQGAAYTSYVAASGVNYIDCNYSPTITAPINGQVLLARVSWSNTSSTVYFSPNGYLLPWYPVVKGNDQPLAIGDIQGGSHWLILQYDSALNKWVLQNPATGITAGANSLAAGGYQKFPGGLILQWGKTGSIPANTSQAVTFPIAFPAACVAPGLTSNYASTANAYSFNVSTPTTTGMTIYNANTTAAAFYWFAIGY